MSRLLAQFRPATAQAGVGASAPAYPGSPWQLRLAFFLPSDSSGFWPRRIRLTDETQVTNDGTIKTHLVTDGRNIYVGEWRNGRLVTAVGSVNGGPTHEIPTPFVQTLPVAISRNGRELLALVGEGEEQEKALWVIPVNGAAPRRVGDFLCHAVAWTEDERHIVYSSGNAVYVTTPGRQQGKANFTLLRQSQRSCSGRVLCQEERSCAIHEIDLATGEQTMIPGSEGLSTARWSPDGRFVAALRSDQHEVWILDWRSRRWRKLAGGVNGNDLAWSRDSRSIYASRPEGEQPELLRIAIPTARLMPLSICRTSAN